MPLIHPTKLSQYVPDPLIKVFDIRMQRQWSPMSMSASSPNFLRFIAASPRSDEDPTATANGTVLLGSVTGVVQVCPIAGDQTASQLIYAPLSDSKEVVTAIAVSSSGQVMSLGTSSGAIAQYVLRLPDGIKPKINDVSFLNQSSVSEELRITLAVEMICCAYHSNTSHS